MSDAGEAHVCLFHGFSTRTWSIYPVTVPGFKGFAWEMAYFTRIFELLNKFNSLKHVSISSYEKSAGSAFETKKHIKSLARQSLLKMIDFCTRARHRLFPTLTLDFD